MICQQQGTLLDDWLEGCSKSTIAGLEQFAVSLVQDYAAVRAALELLWSNGQTEGQAHRLKLIKRQMYGRAKLDLLRLRVLYSHEAWKVSKNQFYGAGTRSPGGKSSCDGTLALDQGRE